MRSGKIYRLLSAALFLLLTCLCFPQTAGAQDTHIRVHLLSGNTVKVSTDGELLLCDGNQKLLTIHGGNTFSLKGGKFLIGESPSSLESFTLAPAVENSIVYVNSRAYRGILELKKREPGKFLVINHVDIEDYLAGVLGGEVSASWPRDALKAQAVAARSYVLFKKKFPRDPDFDVYSTVMDQVYAGIQGESPLLLQIVRETRGQVLTWQGEVIKAYYHSTCGGHTEDGAEVFPEDASFLKGVPCGYCNVSPCFNWEKVLSCQDLTRVLRKNAVTSGELLDMKVTRTDDSRRAAELTLSCSDGEKVLKGSELRMMIGPGQLKSTRFSLKVLERREDTVPIYFTRWYRKLPYSRFINDPLFTGLFLTMYSLYSLPQETGMEILPSAMPSRELQEIPVDAPSEVLTSHLYETKVKVSTRYYFSGEGWGHGVGLCQWGAYGMARQGFDYAAILSHYYPETQLMKIAKE